MIKDIALTIVEYSKERTDVGSRTRQIYSVLREVCLEVGKYLLEEQLKERKETRDGNCEFHETG